MKRFPVVFFAGFLFFFMAASSRLSGQETAPKFKRLTTRNGLSQGHVSAILKDNEGFMWFATDEGLNKYDGYKFIVYKYDPDKPASVSSNFVYDVMQDHTGTLWVGTAAGVDRFDREKNIFIHYAPANATPVRAIFQDSKKEYGWAHRQACICLTPIPVHSKIITMMKKI